MSESDTSTDSDGADADYTIALCDQGPTGSSLLWTPQRRHAQRDVMTNNSRATLTSTATDWFNEEQATGPHVRLTKKDDPTFSVTVNKKRLARAKKLLDPAHIRSVLSDRACGLRCQRKCSQYVTVATITTCRQECFTPVIPDQNALVQHITTILRAIPGNCTNTQRLSYRVGTIHVCLGFFCKAYGVSNCTVDRARALVVSGGNAPTSVVRSSHDLRKRLQRAVAYGFWHHFFEVNCQRPNSEVRLFPVNRSMQFIYDYYFMSWYQKQLPPSDGKNDTDDTTTVGPPSLSTFQRQRWHPHFKDVACRAKHYHCRCYTCANLMARRLKGFHDFEQEQAWQVLFEAHDKDARGWRLGEIATKARARAEPHVMMYITFDDTSCLGIPKFTTRSLKNLPTSRFDVIPFNITNHSTNENSYVYTVKNGWQKGANRLCSILYRYIRKIKFSGGPSSRATILVMHADNYSENKNNEVFLFCCELIYRQWFVEIRCSYEREKERERKRER